MAQSVVELPGVPGATFYWATRSQTAGCQWIDDHPPQNGCPTCHGTHQNTMMGLMWLKHVKTMPSAPSPSHQHFYGWYRPSNMGWVYDCFNIADPIE